MVVAILGVNTALALPFLVGVFARKAFYKDQTAGSNDRPDFCCCLGGGDRGCYSEPRRSG